MPLRCHATPLLLMLPMMLLLRYVADDAADADAHITPHYAADAADVTLIFAITDITP